MENPYKSASIISKLFFHWVTPFVWNGYKKEVTLKELWALNEEDTVEYQTRIFRKHLQREFPLTDPTTRGDKRKGSVFKALVRTFWVDFLLAGFCKALSDGLNMSGPLLMKVILGYLRSDESKWVGVGYTIAMLSCMMMRTVFTQLFHNRAYNLGMHVRMVITDAVYRKALRLSQGARREKTVGEIVNLISNDARMLEDGARKSHMVWSTPLLIVGTTALLYVDLGVSVGAGMLFMLILLPISGSLASLQKKILARQRKNKDNRIRIMNEILTGIRVLKLYAWELGFKKLVDSIRAKELQKLKRLAFLRAFLTMVWFFAPFAVTFVTFAAFIFLNRDQRLTAEVAFTTLALYQALRVPLNKLPNMISNVVQSMVSLKRLDNFLSADELKPYVKQVAASKHVISIEHASFSWTGEVPLLNDVTLRVETGELLGVVGRVGDGKSSMISAILGDMKLLSGEVSSYGSMAYVPQQAWLQNASVRENVLFGKPFDHRRYWDVIRRCALLEDIKILPAGDQTEIGERGINLSGGQKQRISIARAVYADADIYLFDDPLSAVDSHVGLHIFSQVIGKQGMLKNKTRILVMQGVQYLSEVDRIAVMKEGHVSHTGTFAELMNSQGDFRNLIKEVIPVEKEVRIDERRKDRRESDLGIESEPSKNDVINGKIVTKEHTESGSVKYGIYCQYLQHIGYFAAFVVLVTIIGSSAFQAASSFWLNQWSEDKLAANGNHNLMIFGLLGLGQAFCLFFGVLFLVLASLSASRKLHDSLLKSVLRAPISFFDSSPVGRIVNRFANDVEVLDTELPNDIRAWIQHFLSLASILFIICFNLPLFIAIVVIVAIVYYLVQLLYISSSRQLRRLESTTRSSVFSHFGETLQGSTVIRAFRRTPDFIKESDSKINLNAMSYFPQVATNRWLGTRLDLCASCVTFATAVFIVLSKGSIEAGIAGLCLAYALQASSSLEALLRASADIEINIVSIERIAEYIALESEAEWIKNTPPATWPSDGVVEFKGYSTRYRKNLPLVARGINVKINSGEKVGICGRTGAGKTSLTLALFRMLEASEGRIEIDNVPIGDIGLHDLRMKLSIIPQEAVLFSGSLRLNLDPFGIHSDEVLWHAIEHAHLKPFMAQHEKGLDLEVTEGGGNLSVGQRQLVCLARALLRNSKILILDEATAAVDVGTDALIQETIKTEFTASTIITIAHRINTIINYDKILVLDSGEVREYDTPQNLLSNPDSLFSAIAKDHKSA